MPDFRRPSALLIGARRRVALALIPIALLWLAVLWAAWSGRAPTVRATAALPPPVLQTILASGEASPADGSFDHFDVEGRAVPAPANRKGDIVFFASLLRSRAEEGLFLASEGRVAKIVAGGDVTPGGERISGFGERPAASINEAGAVAFHATLTGGKATSGIFLWQKGSLTAIALSGADAPDIPGGTLAEFEAPILNDAGEIVFLASIRRGRDSGEAICLWRKGQLIKLAGSGDPVPGGGGYANFGLPSLNNKSEVAFGAVVERGAILGGIFLKSSVGTNVALAAGSPSPTGGVFMRFSERLALNDAGTIAFSAVLRHERPGPSSAILVVANETPRALAAIGEPAPGGGSFAAFASWPVISQTGAVAFIAAIDGGAGPLALFIAGPDGLRRIVGVGDDLSDGGRIASLPLYPSIEIAPNDAVTFAAFVEQGGARRQKLFYWGPPRRR